MIYLYKLSYSDYSINQTSTRHKKGVLCPRGLIGTCKPRHAAKTEHAKGWESPYLGQTSRHNAPGGSRAGSRTHGDERLQVLSNLGSRPVG